MKKIAYNAPEMEVLNLKISSAILEVSYNTNPGMNDTPDPDDPINPGGEIVE
jgi:hypothetical protein